MDLNYIKNKPHHRFNNRTHNDTHEYNTRTAAAHSALSGAHKPEQQTTLRTAVASGSKTSH
jgi:hypothetical protein